MSPGNSPAPVMLSPAMRTAKVAAGFCDQQLVEIERPVEIVVGRRRKAAGGRERHQRHGERRAPSISRNALMSPARSAPFARRRASWRSAAAGARPLSAGLAVCRRCLCGIAVIARVP